MNSPVQKRSVVVAGHKNSVSLEQEFWDGLKEISRLHGSSLVETLDGIAGNRTDGNLSSAIRLFVLDHYRTQAERSGARLPTADGASQAASRSASVVTPPAFRKSA
jgi:predicted DNA-binding ribbon-helix-helix protein